MNPLTTNELEKMKMTAEFSFFDSCQLGIANVPAFGFDPGNISYTWSEEIACGFTTSGQRTTQQGEVLDGSQASLYDAFLRLPIGTNLLNVDRIKITKRHFEDLVIAEEYRIDGQSSRGPSCLVFKLKLVSGSSAG